MERICYTTRRIRAQLRGNLQNQTSNIVFICLFCMSKYNYPKIAYLISSILDKKSVNLSFFPLLPFGKDFSY